MNQNALDGIKGLLLDLDGTLFVGDQPIEGAINAVNRLRASGLSLRFLTNTTMMSLASLHKKLADMGLPIEPSECFGVIRAAQLYLRKLENPQCYFLLTDDPMADFAEFEIDNVHPDIVLVGDVGKVWDHTLMQKVFEMIMNGAQLVALQKGKFWQTEKGLQVDMGAFIAGLEYVTGQEAIILGKPSPQMFQIALDDIGLPAAEVAMIGDDLDNDIGGAQSAGLKAILVRTGKFREDVLARSKVKPDLIIDSISSLPDVVPTTS